MEVEQIKQIIEKSFDIKILEAEKVKNVYKIKTPDDTLCLKVIRYDLPHFLFILGAIKHLQDRGFNKIPEIMKTFDGRDYIEIGKNYAYLTPWIIARECNYDNPLDIKVAAEKLAELHNKSENFEVKEYMRPRIGWFKWIETFFTRKDEIMDFKRRIGLKNHKSEFDNLYLSALDEEVERAERAVENLMESEYINLMEMHIKAKGFCHHDYAHHNVLFTNNSEVNIIDFDYCILDTHLHDLCSLIIRTQKNGKWDVNAAMDIIEKYSSVKQIFTRDIAVLASFMEFPQDYWQVGIQYYWEEQPWGEEFFIKKLKKILEDRDEKQEFVESFRFIKYDA